MNGNWLKGLLKRVKLNESTVSMVLGALVIIVVGALVFNYFRGVERPEEEAPIKTQETVQLVEKEGKQYPVGLPTVYQVQASDNLWEIAEKYYGSGYNWVDIAKENNLANPNFLMVGQELNLPQTAVIKPMVPEVTVFGPAIKNGQYTVAKGDHLWGIAVRAYGDGYRWVEIARENKITNPDTIDVGLVLTLPE